MITSTTQKPLTIFVHRASECLTDHEAHGEGLICFSLLKGLAERGHRLHAYTSQSAIHTLPSGLTVCAARHRVPANSLAPWEHAYRASRVLKRRMRDERIDLVWHMNPCGSSGCPCPPQTFGLPLVVGPLYYPWPKTLGISASAGKPRLGFGLQRWLEPPAKRGWQQTLTRSAALFCATQAHASAMQQSLPWVPVSDIPLIAEPPQNLPPKRRRDHRQPWTLMFAGNLVPHKNPRVFCETIARLHAWRVPVKGIVVGDGPERAEMEAYTARHGLENVLCFLGKVRNTEIYEYLRDADFLVSTSLGEPYGRSIAEAMSVGTPAVCHRSGGPTDYIHDTHNGLLVDELTGTAYADKLRQALSEPNVYHTLSRNALRQAEEWTSESVLSRVEDVLRRVCR